MEFKFDFDKDRLEKLKTLKDNGYAPYDGKYEVTRPAIKIRENFEKLNGIDTKIAGRIISRRDHGKLKFMDLTDESGTIQIYVTESGLDERSAFLLRYLDIGDIIGVAGQIIKTKAGEISVHAKSITLLSKSLLALPPRWYGLEDTEKRYRKRYLDFTLNPESREKIIKGSKMLSTIRDFLQKRGFLEVTVHCNKFRIVFSINTFIS